MYFLAVCVFILAVAAITSGIIVCYNSYQNLQRHMTTPLPSVSNVSEAGTMPIVTRSGEIINSADQLEEHLQMLNIQLQEKVSALSENKSRASNTEDKIQKLDMTKNEINKFYLRLKNEISRTEYECQELQEQIDEYLKRREIIKKEISDRIDDKTIHPMEKSDEDNIVTEADLTYEEMQKWINEFKNKYNLSLINLESESNQDKDNELIHLQRNDEGVNKAESNKSYIRVCNSINCDYKMAPSSLDLDFLKNESKSTVMREVAL